MRRLLRFVPVLPALLLAACSPAATSGPTPAPDPTTPPPVATDEPPPAPPNAFAEAVDALFAAAEAKDAFSGSVIVVDGGKQVLEKGYGFADRTAKRKNAPDTLFRIGSVSKQFVAAAVLALVQDGKLALTDPISKFFPEYPKENLALEGVEVTVHHLLSQTSGLPDPGATEGFKKIVWRRAIAPSEQIDFVKALPLDRAPGTAYDYLNYNFLLAALVVEKVSGQPYGDFLRTRFFASLAMKDTGTALPVTEDPRAAVGYRKLDEELSSFAETPIFDDRDVSVVFGSGQMYSTVRDLAKWDRALTGETALSAANRDLLFTPNLGGYGYGWVIQKKAGVSFEWHNGALSPLGFTALVLRVPAKDRFVAYLSNMDRAMIQPFELKVEAIALK